MSRKSSTLPDGPLPTPHEMLKNLSYWEYKTWLANIDYTIVGSGIVGLNCAIRLRELFPDARILVLERGSLPQGASTKNAGFACFGSISEILSDLEHHSEEEVLALVARRWRGIQALRSLLGDENIGLENHGGHEVFLKDQQSIFEKCIDKLTGINELLFPVYGTAAFQLHPNSFGFHGVQEQYISNEFESQIDTGLMMAALLTLTQKKGIVILNAVPVITYAEREHGVSVSTEHFDFFSGHLLFATNGFSAGLVNRPVVPARAQVLITRPVPDLHIRGTFHVEEGYYYFRNIDNRILVGGGRNLDFKAEETMEFGETTLVKSALERLLREVILPEIPVEIERYWSGIMGLGENKKPIVEQISDHVYCGVRLGGMGIAIGSSIGRELAELATTGKSGS
jgi:gamma-glutamylputrescine oxidase